MILASTFRPWLRRLVTVGTVTAAAVGLGVLGAPAASAATFTPTVGLYDIPGILTGQSGSAANMSPLINASVFVRTDPDSPEIPPFLGISVDFCPCTVHWRNETTGAGGTTKPYTDLLPSQTGSGTITARVTIDRVSVTLQSGTATWVAP
ncbi:hypothetical protein LZP97_15125 [Rhodococcus sp. DMF-1]|uniref:hypothetical protein n=1 Tax=Rhodococcus TaxID=1827 RepID=UPI000660D5B7|nr:MULTISPECIES: hypothetical protein [Rhodococcus]MDO2377596.1 hypothetical protein [Rhodococcus ruber]UIR35000.1 hypothetical protein LZP97_15125 [Rhodococcus sp. DMF-1]